MSENDSSQNLDEILQVIKSWIKEMKYGNISIIVQDGKVIQTDKTEKIRIK